MTCNAQVTATWQLPVSIVEVSDDYFVLQQGNSKTQVDIFWHAIAY